MSAAQVIDVAILEDQLLMREALSGWLANQGWKISCSTESPAGFLEQVQRAPPDLAVVDLYLGAGESPDSEGWRVIQSLTQWHPQVKVVVLSGSRQPEHVARAASSGAAAYVDKNSEDLSGLAKTLRAVANGERCFPVVSFASSVSGPRTSSPLDALTPRELEVLRYVASGADNLKVAAHLGITERTVRAHVSELYKKLGPENRAQLALMARRLGVSPLGES